MLQGGYMGCMWEEEACGYVNHRRKWSREESDRELEKKVQK
jgi:hypothetical protein